MALGVQWARVMQYDHEDRTLVADHIGAVPLSTVIASARNRRTMPSARVVAMIAVRVLDGAPAGNVSANEVTLALNGSVRVASKSRLPTNPVAVAGLILDMLGGQPGELAHVVATHFPNASSMARSIERAIRLAAAGDVGTWLELSCGHVKTVPPPAAPIATKHSRALPFVVGVGALLVGFAAAWMIAPRSARASLDSPRSLVDVARTPEWVVGHAATAAVPIESLPIATIATTTATTTTSTKPAATTATIDCSNPFRVDERGIRHVRRECF